MATVKPAEGWSPSKAAFARHLVRSLVLADIKKTPLSELPESIVDQKPRADAKFPAPSQTEKKDVVPEGLKVGIIGAGIAGLYTAYILHSLGLKYEILEANPERIGGRLYTHYFTEPKDGTHDYYDIGAMRFPNTPIMSRTFQLFEREKVALGKYIMECPGFQPTRYNDITKVFEKNQPFDPFSVSVKNNGPVPDESVMDSGIILDDAYSPFRSKIKRAIARAEKHPGDPKYEAELERAWQYLMKHDKFSLRDYLGFVEDQDFETVHWLETLNSATGWFDQAFTENVLESLAFEYSKKKDPDESEGFAIDEKDVDWFYIKDGTYKLTEAVLAKLPTAPEKGKQVTSMYFVDKPTDENTIAVQVSGESTSRKYATVMNTTTLAAMQKMDLTGLKLPYATKTAIRSLRYDPSTKVAIKFSEPWWINECHIPGGLGQIKGGLGKTDLPLRTCVYPSYNLEDGEKNSAVLLCSYSWGQDSERIASMVNPLNSTGEVAPKSEALLKETMLHDLALLHSTDKTSYKKMLEHITSLYETHHAYDWSKDPYTAGGAFALFSPGQFSKLYPNLVRPAADSRLHIIGEAASAHHAWIAGALDSAARGVYLFLERFRLFKMRDAMVKEFGHVGEVDEETAHLQVAMGMLKGDLQPRM